jgi:hypothetical protein
VDLSTQFILALIVGLVAFAPGIGIYIAAPAGAAAGVGIGLGVLFTAVGGVLPLFIVHFAYEQIYRIPLARHVLSRLSLEKHQRSLEKVGFWFILIGMPWIGSWILALTAKTIHYNLRKLIPPAIASMTLYSALFFALAKLGINIFKEIDATIVTSTLAFILTQLSLIR